MSELQINKKGIQKITQIFNTIEDFNSFTVSGDPGCDGLGAEIMSIFAMGLRESDSDFHLIAGDVVPFGSRVLYSNMADLVNALAEAPVFTICGNHDTEFYEEYFGLKDYCIADSRTLIIALDDSKRIISGHSLEVLASALKDYSRDNIVLTMHIPPPNSVSSNSISPDEWKKITTILEPYKNKLKYIVCGHLHSYFEDQLDGTALLVTGGAGARIEIVEGIVTPYNHVVDFFYDKDGKLSHKKRDIHLKETEYGDPKIKDMLLKAFGGECMAHVRYRLYAEDAEKRGMKNAAKLFRAAADSEWYHAKNFYYAVQGLKEPEAGMAESMENERHEVEELYKECSEYAKEKSLGLPAYAFNDALMAEKVHLALFKKALEELKTADDITDAERFVCSSCGYTFSGAGRPEKCPICGAPADKIFPSV
jgi:rubrerythrin